MACRDDVMEGNSIGRLTFLAAMSVTQLAYGGGMHPAWARKL
jgi:hypothetical protein